MMKEENIKEKKKQKAPLGIRPDDYIDINYLKECFGSLPGTLKMH